MPATFRMLAIFAEKPIGYEVQEAVIQKPVIAQNPAVSHGFMKTVVENVIGKYDQSGT